MIAVAVIVVVRLILPAEKQRQRVGQPPRARLQRPARQDRQRQRRRAAADADDGDCAAAHRLRGPPVALPRRAGPQQRPPLPAPLRCRRADGLRRAHQQGLDGRFPVMAQPDLQRSPLLLRLRRLGGGGGGARDRHGPDEGPRDQRPQRGERRPGRDPKEQR